MKRITRYYIFIIMIAGLISSCKKGSYNTGNITPDSVATVTISGDTTIVSFDNITIRYSKTPPCYPDSEIFTFTATARSGIPASAVYTWYFGDGYTTTGTTVQHAYDASSPYVLLLNITNGSGGDLLNTVTFSVQAWGKQIKPVADFYTQSDFPTNLNYITFNSTSSLNKGAIVHYLWDWGDGTTESSSQQLTRHQFPAVVTDKTYPVKLTITTDAGCTGDTVINVTVPATYPISGDFNAVAYNACTNEYFLFTPTAVNVPAGATYTWNFSTGRGDTTATLPIRYSFPSMNDYDVIMTIYLNGRLIYTTHKAVNAKGPNPTPVASFYSKLESINASAVVWSFNSTSVIAHGGIDGYAWDFGNGNTDNQYNSFVETTYSEKTTSVSYQVRLIASGNGCSDTAYQTVTVPGK
jgi:hypothetical protein